MASRLLTNVYCKQIVRLIPITHPLPLPSGPIVDVPITPTEVHCGLKAEGGVGGREGGGLCDMIIHLLLGMIQQ